MNEQPGQVSEGELLIQKLLRSAKKSKVEGNYFGATFKTVLGLFSAGLIPAELTAKTLAKLNKMAISKVTKKDNSTPLR